MGPVSLPCRPSVLVEYRTNMAPTHTQEYSVSAYCPRCRATAIFDSRQQLGHPLGMIVNPEPQVGLRRVNGREVWVLLKCCGCSRGALAEFRDSGNAASADLATFHPLALPAAALPAKTDPGVVNEYREAERCASAGAWRGASALIRSALEKALKANGYTQGMLAKKIDDAAADGVITSSRRPRAHDDVRVLGNEIVHDEWRAVDEAEVEAALRYTQRVLEDLYDDRAEVEKILRAKGRLQAAP